MTTRTQTKIGITTTVPIEAILASGAVPYDLNNAFISHSSPRGLIRDAERDGLPRNICNWVKGIYAVAKAENVDHVIAVDRGDCDAALAATRLLSESGVRVTPFSFPRRPDVTEMRKAIAELCDELGTTGEAAQAAYEDLADIRKMASQVDLLGAKGVIPSAKVFTSLIGCTDLESDPTEYRSVLESVLSQYASSSLEQSRQGPKLALIGVPPIYTDLLDVIESLGGQVVFQETPRSFSLAPSVGCKSIHQAYSDYRYPYGYRIRLADIRDQCVSREVDGVIHYVQTFCPQGIEQKTVERGVAKPYLLLDGDAPGPTDSRTKLRLEAFMESLLHPRLNTGQVTHDVTASH